MLEGLAFCKTHERDFTKYVLNLLGRSPRINKITEKDYSYLCVVTDPTNSKHTSINKTVS
jgi:hypothetical protein